MQIRFVREPYGPQTTSINEYIRMKLKECGYGGGTLEILHSYVDSLLYAVAGLFEHCAKTMNDDEIKTLAQQMGVYIGEDEVFEIIRE